MKRALVSILIICGCFAVITSCSKKPTVKPDYSIKLASDTLTLVAGTTGQITSTNYSASQLTWVSSDTTVATADNTGLLTALKAGQVTISIKNAAHSVSTTFTLTVTPGKFTDIGVGADGSVFLIGATTISNTGGYSIFRMTNNEIHKLPDCAAVRIAVSPQGVPWVINSSNLVFNYTNGKWNQLPGNGTDIGIGGDGSVFAVSTVVYSPTGGYTILKWNGSGWDTMTDCSGEHIAVSPGGIPWVANLSNVVYQYSGSVLWNQVPGVLANNITIGANGAIYVTGSGTGNVPVYQYVSGSWSQVSGVSGTSIAIGPDGKLWWIDASGSLHTQ